jgi:ribonuclease P protein subunit RPR2
MRALLVMAEAERAAEVTGLLALQDPATAGDLDRARWMVGLSEPDLLVIDAAFPWAADLITVVAEDSGTSVLVVAQGSAVVDVPTLLRRGADGFLDLPSQSLVATMALEAALLSRARRRASRIEIEGARWQLSATGEELRRDLERERVRARDLAMTLTRVERSYVDTVRSLAIAVDVMDPTTSRPIERVAEVAESLAALVDPALASEPHLGIGFLLHDLGEIAVPHELLTRPGPLSHAELAAVRQHSLVGAELVEQIDLLRPIAPIIRHHHERWDGSGYPYGLAGEAIPVGARIFAVADAADAMLHDRPYRNALPLEQATEELHRGAGAQFDPTVVDAFMTLMSSSRVSPFA